MLANNIHITSNPENIDKDDGKFVSRNNIMPDRFNTISEPREYPYSSIGMSHMTIIGSNNETKWNQHKED